MKQYDRIIFKPKITLTASDGHWMPKLQAAEIYGTLTSSMGSSKDYPTDWCLSAQFLKNSTPRNFSVYQKDLIVIEPKDYEKYENISADYEQKEFAKEIAERKKFGEEILGNYQDKDWCVQRQVKTTTSYVFVRQGLFSKDSVITSANTKYLQGCCDFIKTLSDFEYYIPQAYLNQFDYTVWDVAQWVNFIQNCMINVDCKFIGLKDFPAVFGQKVPVGVTETFEYKNNYIYPYTGHPTVQINVKSGKFAWHNYLYLVLLRYLHHPSYYWIPGLAMQIKDALQENVTNFEALLMAHLHNYSTGSNGLVYSSHKFDVFITPKTVLQGLESKGMNSSFVYGKTYDKVKCKKLIEEKKYEELLEYLKTTK